MMLLTFLGVLVAYVLTPVVNGLVLSILWGWFMTSTFALPTLPMIQAIGIALIFKFLTHVNTNIEPDKDDPEDQVIGILTNAFITPGVTLLVGWILHLFM